MNAERLLAQFERISEAPDAIARLRRFILDLAVRGKLVEQDPDEATPPQDLYELRKQKDLAYPVEGLRARKPITAIQPTELWFKFPHSWMLCRFDDALVIVSGVTKGQRIPSGETSVDVPYLRVANVQRGWLDLNEVKSITVRASDVDRYRLADQDILMTEGGDWDKLGRAAIWRGEITRCIHQNHIFRLRIPSDSILPEWVVLYANSDCGRRFFEDSSKQTTNLASINLTQLRSCPIPLPPLAEQHRIVAKVNELMALCDQLEAARQQREHGRERLVDATLQRLNQPAEDPASFRKDASFALQVLPSLTTTPAQIKQLRQTILNLAVRGKLVEQDPEDEPADDLLATISFERVDSVKSRKMKSSRSVAPYDGDGEYELPRGWTWSQLGSITAVEDGAMCDGPFGSKLKTEHYISEPGFAVVRLGNIGIGEFLWGKEGHITSEHFESLPGNHIRPGDLLIAGLADPLVRCCEAPANLGPAVNKADCFRLRLHRLINRFFVCQFLNSPVAKSFAAEENHGMTRERINLGNAKSIPIPLPPLAEQHRIVAKVDELMALCDQLEQQLSQADQQRRRLLEAVLAEALGGRLPTAQEESHAAIA
jgi:type I restriction enzyme S subunit